MLGVSGKRGNEPAFNLFKQMSGSKPQAKEPILDRKLYSRAFQSQQKILKSNFRNALNFFEEKNWYEEKIDSTKMKHGCLDPLEEH